MAQFGAKRPRFAPVATTPDDALPTYNFESVVTIGKLVAANLTVTNASGELYGDDALAEKIDMFASGSLELQTDDKTGGGSRGPPRGHAGRARGRAHRLRQRRSAARRSRLLQGAYPKRRARLSRRFSSPCERYPRQRQRGDKGELYHVRHVHDHLYRVPLQLRRMAYP